MTQPVTGKDALRGLVRARRRDRSSEDRDLARAGIRQHVLDGIDRLRLAAGATVAAYEPLRTEPGSTELLTALSARGYRVLVPITLADRDLDWYELGRPTPLGVDAIGAASVVLLPAFAVDGGGNRLGRGGGSYDRALTRLAPGTLTVALLFADEIVPEVPADPWDRPVRATVTPHGWQELGPTGRGNS